MVWTFCCTNNTFIMVFIQASLTCVILFITGLDCYIQYMQNMQTHTHTPDTSRPTQALFPLSFYLFLPLCSSVVVSNSWHVCVCVSVKTGSPLGGVMTQIKISCSEGLWHHQQITQQRGWTACVFACVCSCTVWYSRDWFEANKVWREYSILKYRLRSIFLPLLMNICGCPKEMSELFLNCQYVHFALVETEKHINTQSASHNKIFISHQVCQPWQPHSEQCVRKIPLLYFICLCRFSMF